MSPQCGAEGIVQCAYPVRGGNDISVVKEREDGLSVSQLRLDFADKQQPADAAQPAWPGKASAKGAFKKAS